MPLVKGQFRLGAHTYVEVQDPLPVELNHAAKDGQHQPAVRGGGVGPADPEGSEPGALLGEEPSAPAPIFSIDIEAMAQKEQPTSRLLEFPAFGPG
jgi:hypothetical protein